MTLTMSKALGSSIVPAIPKNRTAVVGFYVKFGSNKGVISTQIMKEF